MTDIDSVLTSLPDPDAASRFLIQLAEKHPSKYKRLATNDALLSDVATLVSYSPLFSITLLQNPEHVAWLGRKRMDSAVRDKQELLESFARFSLTNSQVEPHVILARFRRRELMRIFLRDIRRLSTVAEITDEISNLADAILEHALRLSRQELDNRFGGPLEIDDKGRKMLAEFCIVSLGKLGSKELNYSSDIDLLFIYSGEGTTSGSGTRGSTSNLEYFSKLSESITKLVGGQGGEGSAYRVDLRLRPNGRVGPLALPLTDTIRYYQDDAAAWERQVLIRSRASAGSEAIFRRFYSKVEDVVFSPDVSVDAALANVRLSKQKIDLEKRAADGIDVKLGVGGIREIEFIAQALQLAHGGRDRWLRASHTLISLTRLSERGHIDHTEHTQLFEAYEFLRRLEHILQMENGLQTHLVPTDLKKRELISRRMGFEQPETLESETASRMADVNRIFQRVFNTDHGSTNSRVRDVESPAPGELRARQSEDADARLASNETLEQLRQIAPRFAAIIDSNPELLSKIISIEEEFPARDYSKILHDAVTEANEFRERLGVMRRKWTQCLIEIAAYDAADKLVLRECKRLQTELAEASIEAALWITERELERRYSIELGNLPLAVLGLGKLGGGGLDYDSDLDLVMVYDSAAPLSVPGAVATGEFYAKAVEIFTTVLSSITRDGSLYRVDLRLRPHGGKGPVVSSRSAFIEYFRSNAAIWEMLAFVKLRAVGGDTELAASIENETRGIIHERASKFDTAELAAETLSVRDRLEKQKLGRRRSKDIDIKYGEGGLLDVYFAVRYLQLRFNVPDDSTSSPPYARSEVAAGSADGVVLSPVKDRSTEFTLDRLAAHSPLVTCHTSLTALREGYEFLAALDHNLRLTIGRTTRLPVANENALSIIASRMELSSADDLLEQLTVQRLSIREAFDRICRPEDFS